MFERPNTLSGLLDKRRELAGQIEYAQLQLRALMTDLEHLDATIRMFDPSADLTRLRPKPYAPTKLRLRGEVARFVFTALRTAGKPLTPVQLAREVCLGRGLDPTDPHMAKLVRKRVNATMSKLRMQGAVEKDGEAWRLCG